MLRWFFRILAGISTLFCLTCVSLWLRSYWASDSVSRENQSINGLNLIQESYWGSSGRGLVCINHNFGHWQFQSPAEVEWYRQRTSPMGVQWNHETRYFSISAAELYLRSGHRLSLGFGFTWDSGGGINPVELRSWQLVFPWAAPTILFLLLPFLQMRIFLKSRRRQFRLSHDLCPRCGYDLRASREKCPECGAIATSGVA